MKRPCRQCQASFDIAPEHLEFYEKISPEFNGKKELIPPPTFCPECRQQRRVAIVNQLCLYKRKCDFSGEEIISNHHEDSPHKVYRQDIWYSDVWDPLSYGRDFDFSKTFFEQFRDLVLAVPRPSLQTGYQYDENSEYTNHAGKNKNCYMIFDSDENRDCYYCYSVNGSESCMDCFRVRKSQLCYGCIDCLNCYGSSFLQDCDNCMDSMFLKNCIGCKNCLMSSNLHNKEYFVQNKKVSKEEFQKIKSQLTSHASIKGSRDHFETLKLKYPQKYMHGMHNENVLGDYLTHSKNAQYCFDSPNLWDCTYVFQAFNPLKDAIDIQECGDGEMLYECSVSGYGVQNMLFCSHTLGDASDVLYSRTCPHSKHLFGCTGLRHKEYCIFNKQYTKDEYEELVPKIIAHMRSTGEYGEFFPIEHSPWAYNETLAQHYFPLTREEALKRGYQWLDPDPKQMQPASYRLPDGIKDVPDSVTHELLACETCKKNYRIVTQELALCRQMSLPLPRECFDCRLRATMKKRNPRKLWKRSCGKCKTQIQTTYSPDRPEIVFCEECYLKEVY